MLWFTSNALGNAILNARVATVNQRFHFKASLSDSTLPEMLHSIERFRVPGVIEARNEETTKHVYIRDGYVIHAASSDRADSLGDHLVREGKISTEAYAEVSAALQSSNQRLGVLLLKMKLLTPAEVLHSIKEQIEAIVWSLFFWRDGEVNFNVGEFYGPEMVQIQLPMRQVIVRGIRQAPQARPLVGRLGRRDTVFEPRFNWEDLIEIGLDGDEAALLELVDGRRTLYDLCAEGPLAPAENAKLLYAFQTLQLVRRSAAGEVGSEGGGPVKVQLKTGGEAMGG